jgi:hypothetical protein
MKNILFLTSTNLAANPRLLKELKLATANGYSATVIQFSIGNWSDGMTNELQQQFTGTEFIQLSALRKPFRSWMLSTVLQKICSILPIAFRTDWMLSVSNGKRSFLLLEQLKKMREKYEWVIAHNPAAFYPALWYGKSTGAKVGIDVEDYHPGETNNAKEADSMRKLMQAVLPSATYCSYAAPLIAAEVQKDIPGMTNKQLTILNGFDDNEFIEPLATTDEVLRLVWFSQNIDAGRGLEEVLPVVQQLYPAVELHLVGQLNHSFEEKFLRNKTGIVIHEPMPQKQLHQFLAKFDVGLATDIPVNRNRDIALTNKILAYAQAGLAIAAMHTSAQDQFLSNSNLLHVQMENNTVSITAALQNLYSKKKNAELNKQKQFETGRLYAWQKIAQPLLAIWENNYA